MLKIDPALKVAIDTYVLALDALKRAHTESTYKSLAHDPMWIEYRQKYAKIGYSNSVYSYINLFPQTVKKDFRTWEIPVGAVVKGNWKGPERAVLHIVRGNVFDGSWLDWHGPYGIGYTNGHGEFRRMLSDEDYLVARDAVQANNNEAAIKILTEAIRNRIRKAS